jgi:hypothetical protein
MLRSLPYHRLVELVRVEVLDQYSTGDNFSCSCYLRVALGRYATRRRDR